MSNNSIMTKSRPVPFQFSSEVGFVSKKVMDVEQLKEDKFWLAYFQIRRIDKRSNFSVNNIYLLSDKIFCCLPTN